MTVDAVILAGGDGAVIDPAVQVKGLVAIAGRPMVEWVIDAMRAATTVSGIAVVVPTATGLGKWVDEVDEVVISDGRFADNVVAGIDAFGGRRAVVIATADLPALTPEAVDAFVTSFENADAELAYPLIFQKVMEEGFPGSQRTYIKIKAGRVTGGNLTVVTPAMVKKNVEFAQRLFDLRKNPLGLAQAVGVPFVFKLISGRLELEEAEARLSELLGGKCAAINIEHACIGADVDKPIDVIVAERVLYQNENRIKVS
ncbi:MAG: nucleotidyltransferase family protein [Coriobacteriia bacterium]|nr:nucleotidyltransferase family protein [Coriobacteriia bacterium]